MPSASAAAVPAVHSLVGGPRLNHHLHKRGKWGGQGRPSALLQVAASRAVQNWGCGVGAVASGNTALAAGRHRPKNGWVAGGAAGVVAGARWWAAAAAGMHGQRYCPYALNLQQPDAAAAARAGR